MKWLMLKDINGDNVLVNSDLIASIEKPYDFKGSYIRFSGSIDSLAVLEEVTEIHEMLKEDLPHD